MVARCTSILSQVALGTVLSAAVSLYGQDVRPSSPAARSDSPTPLLTPQEELKSFVLAPGLRTELVADGAVIREPLAIRFSPDGRLWVLETDSRADNRGRNDEPGVGGVAVLEDTDGDGRMDKRTTFATGLIAPCGILLVGDGVIVLDPPHFWFLCDRDGDSVSDERTKIAVDNTERPDRAIGLNGLVLAIDNWVYSAASTVCVRYVRAGNFIADRTIRRAGRSITQDETGRLYYGGDGNMLYFDPISPTYLWRNPGYRAGGTGVPVPLGKPPGGAGGIPEFSSDRSESEPAMSAGGAIIYRGKRFGPEFEGNVFVSEPNAGRVIRSPLREAENEVPGRPVRPAIEVLHSTDPHFRPVSLAQGPDAALYMVDRYGGGPGGGTRRVAADVPNRTKNAETDVSRRGRIWRVVPDASRVNVRRLLKPASVAELVEALGDDNGWRRDTAQRILIEKGDPAATPIVREYAVRGQAPLGRLHALWTLDGLDAFDRDTALRVLEDVDARVCSAAIRLSEKFMYPLDDAQMLARLAGLAGRRDPAVRLQLALSLGEAARPETDAVIRRLLVSSANQPFLVDAALSGIGSRETNFVEQLAREASRGNSALARAVAGATHSLLGFSDRHWMTLKPAAYERATPLFKLASDAATPEWVRTAILDGIEQYVPKAPDGRLLAANVGVEPRLLLALADNPDSADSTRAKRLVRALNWPGKKIMTASEPEPLTPEHQALLEKGRAAFPIACAGCHQPQGQGLAGLAPPLAGSRWVQADPRIITRIVLCGKVQEGFSMPTLRGSFDDETIAGVLTFIRRSWSNAAGPVTPAVVAEVRAATANRYPMAFDDIELIELAGEFARARR